MSIETKIRNLIKYMDDHDQPYEDIFEEIIKLVNNHHEERNKQTSAHECPQCESDLEFYGGLATCPNDDCKFERKMTLEELEEDA